MACKGHESNSDDLESKTVTGQNCSRRALCSQVDQRHYPDHRARSTAKHQMHQENALEPLPFELPLPGEDSGNQDRHRCQRRRQQIAIGCCCQNALFFSLRQIIKFHPCDKQRDRKMNQDHVLRVFRQ